MKLFTVKFLKMESHNLPKTPYSVNNYSFYTLNPAVNNFLLNLT